ncbi:TPA: hypothetical protein I6209_002963 [Vibrio cholerae]|uniref:hypothetical protein n=2 Tax=Vibrio cholerae TaxID=666 RepID=UPI00105A1606|nr:hypothetical protein [Vibrio cholerae]EJL6466869.1 hypothetical protein [Vibrio cholerae]MBP0925228.1 hypothetical protein [Vibrio cholerae]MCX9488961.1 hypothetical protein [Vibrio cholerae]MCX9522129.1 hypothetical protein [Vibrio cholerae]TDK79742.1 hypothetical protein E2O02_16945 [Vibrio cholerae]
MQQHILIKLATKKPFSEQPEMPEGTFYDSSRGYWFKSDEILVSYHSEFGTMVSKKCDIETGEDQKGE